MAAPARSKPYPQAVQLSAGQHEICACRQSAQWPHCDGQRACCKEQALTLNLSEPKFLWLCQCGLSLTLPYCDGDGHIRFATQQSGGHR